MERASLSYIFFTFLKLGATAFGGYMSLVAIVQKQLLLPESLFPRSYWLYFFRGCISPTEIYLR